MAKFSTKTTKFNLCIWNDQKQNGTTIPKVLVTHALSGKQIKIIDGTIYKHGDTVRLYLEIAPCND